MRQPQLVNGLFRPANRDLVMSVNSDTEILLNSPFETIYLRNNTAVNTISIPSAFLSAGKKLVFSRLEYSNYPTLLLSTGGYIGAVGTMTKYPIYPLAGSTVVLRSNGERWLVEDSNVAENLCFQASGSQRQTNVGPANTEFQIYAMGNFYEGRYKAVVSSNWSLWWDSAPTSQFCVTFININGVNENSATYSSVPTPTNDGNPVYRYNFADLNFVHYFTIPAGAVYPITLRGNAIQFGGVYNAKDVTARVTITKQP